MKAAIYSERQLDHPLSIEANQYSLNQLEHHELNAYDAVLVVGSGKVDEETALSVPVIEKLWRYVEQGGRLYAELISAFDFPSSRLFGWKQDFPKSRRTLEKLRVALKDASLPQGALLEWEGAMAYGFSIHTETWLDFGAFRQTRESGEDDGTSAFPGLLSKKMGKGLVVYSAFSLLSRPHGTVLRPHWLWNQVLAKLSQATGIPLAGLDPIIRTGADKPAEEAVRRNAQWFLRSGMLPEEDGSTGVYENVHSVTARVSPDRRPDCHAHTALMMHLYSRYTKDPSWSERAHRLLQYLFDQGYQDMNPESETFGFFKWYQFPGERPDQIFTDDNAWVCFVLLYLYRRTGKEEYKRRGMAVAQALLSTQHETGLRPNMLIGAEMEAKGAAQASAEHAASFNPHFESIAHAAFLQAYLVSQDSAYLDTAMRGSLALLERMGELKFMYSRTSGLSRFLLPLGYLSRKDPTGRIRQGLDEVTHYLLSHLHSLGGIEEADNPDPERFGQEDTGVFLYNGEEIADQLYTNNFLLMNAWEAWKATREDKYAELYQNLSRFLCGIQIESPNPLFDGGWMRAYDLRHREYFGNNGDTGWGPYCMESGWTNAITSAGLLLGLLDESVFDE